MELRKFATIAVFFYLLSQNVQCSDIVLRSLTTFCKIKETRHQINCLCEDMNFKPYYLNVEFNITLKLQCDSVEFQRSSFGSLPKNIFNIATPGKEFLITYAQLTSVEGFADADGLEYVKTLLLDGNQLTYLPNAFLSGARSLQQLSIASNGLTTLESDCFAGLRQLRLLYLENNTIITLPETIFLPMPKLQLVKLSKNKLRTIPEQIFRNKTYLSRIYLQYNELTTIPLHLFENLGNLERLDLGDNLITHIAPDCIGILDRLEHLTLSNNQISELHENAFHNNGNLISLRIENNALETIPPTLFDAMEHLRYLFLGGNKLRSLPGNIFLKNPMLRNISLANNEFVFGTAVLGVDALTAQEKLLLAVAEPISPRIFDGLRQLELLNLSGNIYLHLSEGAFQSLPSLAVLDLTNSKCSKIDANTFRSNVHLQELHLGSNRLEEFDVQCLPLDSFKELYLENNNIMQIKNYERFSQFTQKLIVDIDDNSLDCSHLDSIAGYLARHESNVANVECFAVEADLDD